MHISCWHTRVPHAEGRVEVAAPGRLQGSPGLAQLRVLELCTRAAVCNPTWTARAACTSMAAIPTHFPLALPKLACAADTISHLGGRRLRERLHGRRGCLQDGRPQCGERCQLVHQQAHSLGPCVWLRGCIGEGKWSGESSRAFEPSTGQLQPQHTSSGSKVLQRSTPRPAPGEPRGEAGWLTCGCRKHQLHGCLPEGGPLHDELPRCAQGLRCEGSGVAGLRAQILCGGVSRCGSQGAVFRTHDCTRCTLRRQGPFVSFWGHASIRGNMPDSFTLHVSLSLNCSPWSPSLRQPPPGLPAGAALRLGAARVLR